MNNKLLLVNAITLLYRESQLKNNQENSAVLVRDIVKSIQLPELQIGVDYERDIINDLKQTAIYMCECPPGYEFEQFEILQRVKIACREDTNLYDAFADGIVPELAETTIKRNCMNISRMLMEFLKEEKIKTILTKAANAMRFGRNKITNMKDFLAEIGSQLEPYQIDTVLRDPAIISFADTSDLVSSAAVFENVKNEATGSAVYRTGWQGLNRALDGGTRGGEEWVQAALQHNYKSGMNTSVFMDTALYNVPVLKDPNKKAALIHISCEDPLYMKYQFMFKRLKGIEAQRAGKLEEMTEEVISNMIASMSAQEMAAYVNDALSVNGFTCFFIEINPGMATYRTLQNEVLRLEAEGYEVQMLSVDYLLKVPTTGCEGNAAGEALRNMYEKMASFSKHRSMRFMTPHQISTDAKMMIREGRSGFVQQLIGGGYYAGSKQLDQVVDLETFQHIEALNGKKYLTIQRGKHRKDQIRMTPQEHLYFVLEFHPVFGLLPDVEGPDTTRKKVGGGTIGSADEIPFWEAEGNVI